jgi:hypothetical protein
MRPQFSIFLAILILFVKSAAAQVYPPVPGDLKLTAVFDFVAEKQALSAGNYIVHWEKASNTLEICEDGVSCETVQASAIKAARTPARPKVILAAMQTGIFFGRSGSRMALDLSCPSVLWNQKRAGQ